MFFCDFAGFPEFLGGTLSVSGEVGEFTVDHQIALDIGLTGLDIKFSSLRKISEDGRAFKDLPHYFNTGNQKVPAGNVELKYVAANVLFQSPKNDTTLPVDVHIRLSFNTVLPGDEK